MGFAMHSSLLGLNEIKHFAVLILAIVILTYLVLRELAEEELKTNIAETEVFVLPSGQEIEKEGNIV